MMLEALFQVRVEMGFDMHKYFKLKIDGEERSNTCSSSLVGLASVYTAPTCRIYLA